MDRRANGFMAREFYLIKHLLSTYYIPGNVVGMGRDTNVCKRTTSFLEEFRD